MSCTQSLVENHKAADISHLSEKHKLRAVSVQNSVECSFLTEKKVAVKELMTLKIHGPLRILELERTAHCDETVKTKQN